MVAGALRPRRRHRQVPLYDCAYTHERGHLTVAATVEPSGEVSQARIESSTLRRPAVGRCVLRRVRERRFPWFSASPFSAQFPVVFAGE